MIIALTIAVMLPFVLWNLWLTGECLRLSDLINIHEHGIDANKNCIGDLREKTRVLDGVFEIHSRKLSAINERLDESGEIEKSITQCDRVSDLESAFALRFGLSVQDVLNQKQVAKAQEQAYYAEKEQG